MRVVRHGAPSEVIEVQDVQRIALHEVGAALEDHEQRRTTGRTVVDLSLDA
ncbi:MAG: hypothetical protein H0W25_04415 [Acidimicrobiia bacterium]|nr:hypothetical protein [Acidimicrobiia bacterium]